MKSMRLAEMNKMMTRRQIMMDTQKKPITINKARKIGAKIPK